MNTLLADIEALYEGSVMEPAEWAPHRVADWIAAVASTEQVDRELAKLLRRVVKMAERLQRFWLDDQRLSDSSIPWQSRVDMALGARAWRPVLDVANHLLELQPSHDLFDSVGELFRIVNNRPWLEGSSFEEWEAGSGRIL